MRSVRSVAAVLVLGLLAAGCDTGPTRAQAAEEAAARAAETVAKNDPELQDPLGEAVAAQAKTSARGFVKVDHLWRGELTAHERRSFLVVMVYGHCYRFVAAGGGGVRDLDLALLDGNGVEMQRDVTEDPNPVLGEQASICPSGPGAYRIEVRMRTGEGPFALGLFRDTQ